MLVGTYFEAQFIYLELTLLSLVSAAKLSSVRVMVGSLAFLQLQFPLAIIEFVTDGRPLGRVASLRPLIP